MKINQALILINRLANRISLESQNYPTTIPIINNEPFLNNILWNLKRHDIKDIFLIGYSIENFKKYYEDGQNMGLKISYLDLNIHNINGGLKLSEIQKKLDDFFLIMNGENIFEINYHDLSKSISEEDIGILALNFMEDVSGHEEVILENGRITSCKKSGVRNSGYINAGVGIFNKKILNSHLSLSQENIFLKLIQKKVILAKKFNSFFIDISMPQFYKAAEKLLPIWKSRSALILDRDGVINEDFGYVHSMKNFQWIKYAKETIKLANDLGLLVIVITNQSGIARGLYTEEIFQKFTKEINNQLIESGAHIDATYYCPHHPKEGNGKFKRNCNCRKPKPGLLRRAISDWNLDPKKCFLIGDRETDILLAKKCNISSYLFSSKTDNLLNIFKNKFQHLIN